MRAYDPLVRSIASRMFRSPFEQEEAIQEIWMHAFRRRESLDVNRLETFGGWLKALGRNKCVDVARAKGRFGAEVPTEDLAVHTDPVAPIDTAEVAELRAAVQAFKDGLKNDTWRRAFELHFERELRVNEVADRMGISAARAGYLKAVILKRARASQVLLRALGKGGPHRAAS
jgi:RNA polymerase sigma factor (sigma-70 family)